MNALQGSQIGLKLESDCTACSSGSFCAGHGAQPADCAAGYICPSANNCIDDTCSQTLCQPGSYCEAGRTPSQCDPTKYNPFYGASSSTGSVAGQDCLNCLPGYECADPELYQLTDSDLCPAGEYSDGSGTCEECTAEHYIKFGMN